jgi:hypothetical protein
MELDRTNGANDILETGSLVLDKATLYLFNVSAENYAVGDRFKILESKHVRGEFEAIYPLYPSSDLYWDTTNLREFGLIEVTDQQPTETANPLANYISVCPNPTSGILDIAWSGEIGRVELIELITMEGRVVAQLLPDPQSGSIRLHLEDMHQGLYVLRITSAGQAHMEKIMKKSCKTYY